eukprot:jgi/Tetstr1/437785/TSEL_026439.t1
MADDTAAAAAPGSPRRPSRAEDDAARDGTPLHRASNRLEDFKGKMDEKLEQMKADIVGAANPHDVGRAMLDKVANVSGDQLVANFLKLSLSSARTRRQVGSAAAAEVAQALLVQHAKPVIDPALEGAAALGRRVAGQVATATVDALLGTAYRLAAALQRAALGVLLGMDELLGALTPEALRQRALAVGGRPCTAALRGLVLLCLGTTLHVLLAHSSTGTCLATAAGGLAGLLMSADYWQHRAQRALRAHILSSEWVADGLGADVLTHFNVEGEDTVGKDGRLVHHGVNWLNSLLASIWPNIAVHLGDLLRRTVNDVVSHFKPSFVSSLEIVACDLGNLPIDVRRMRMERSDRSEINFDAAIVWDGQVAIDLVVEVSGARFFTQIRHLRFRGDFNVRAAPLVPVFPGFAGIAVSLIKPPELDFKVAVKQVYTPEAIVLWLKRFIVETVNDLLLWPNRIVLPVLDERHPSVGPYMGALLARPCGVLRVQVVAAQGLEKMDMNGSDPYVLIDTSRSEFRVTKTISRSQSPVWDETCFLRVFELSRALHVEVWDEDSTSADDLLGRCCVHIAALTPGKEYDRWYDLGMESFHSVDGCGSGCGRIHLRATWWPIEEMQAGTGVNVVDTRAEDYREESLGSVQQGCVFAQVVQCSDLQGPGGLEEKEEEELEYSAQVACAGHKFTSTNAAPKSGVAQLCFSAQFYDVSVTEQVVIKVLSRSAGASAPALLGVLSVPLAFPALSAAGRLAGTYTMAGRQQPSVTVKLQWLPLDGAPLPFPPRNHARHGALSIHLEKAADLINADLVGLSDPFVKLSVNSVRKTSTCLQETLNPVWNEDFHFLDVSTKDTLHVRVRDKDRVSSDSLGEVALPLAEVAARCGAAPDGRWRHTWALAGVKHGTVTMALAWDEGHRFAESISLDSRILEVRGTLKVAELPPERRKLPEAMALRHWAELPSVDWAGALCYSSNRTPTSASSTPMRVAPRVWSVVAILHSVRGLESAKEGTDGEEPTSPGGVAGVRWSAVLRLGDELAHRADDVGEGTRPRGFEWGEVPRDTEDDLTLELWPHRADQTGPPTASIAIPLSTAWTACERYLSGSFRLTGAALCAEVELAWARCRGDPPLSVSPSRKRVSVAAPYSESGTLHVLLASARGLRAADSNGSSDPYTVLKVDGERRVSSTKHRSLNPTWNEMFTFPDTAGDSILRLRVYDKDTLSKDFLGEGSQAQGVLYLQLKFEPSAEGSPAASRRPPRQSVLKSLSGRALQALTSSPPTAAHTGRLGSLAVVLESGQDLVAMDSNGRSDPFCTLKVADTRHVSSVKSKTLNPMWSERFEFPNVSPADNLKINVWDKDFAMKDRMGSSSVAVSQFLTPNMRKYQCPVLLKGEHAGHIVVRAMWTENDLSDEAKAVFAPQEAHPAPAVKHARSKSAASAGSAAPRGDGDDGDLSDGSPASASSPRVGERGAAGLPAALSPLGADWPAAGESPGWQRVKLLHCVWAGLSGLAPPKHHARSLFVAFKLGHERFTTAEIRLEGGATELATRCAFRMPLVADDDATPPSALRARLYERHGFPRLKHLLGEVSIPLAPVEAAGGAGLAGESWPLAPRHSVLHHGQAVGGLLLDLATR